MDEVKILNWLMVATMCMVFSVYIFTAYVANQTTSYDLNTKGVAAFLG